MKDFFIKHKVVIIVVVAILFLGVFSLLIDSNAGVKMKDDINEWIKDVKKDEYTVTVIAKTGCGFCELYEPVMKSVLSKNKDMNVYWFEMDVLNQNDPNGYKALMETFDISDFGGTPYTFIVKNGELVTTYSDGSMGEEALTSFLKENNVIK